MHCDTQCSSSGSLVFPHLGGMREKPYNFICI